MSGPPGASRLLRRWEELPIPAQLAGAGIPLIVLVFVLHVAFFPNLSTGLALSYGVFWGSLATGAVVGATRSERARRIARESAADRSER